MRGKVIGIGEVLWDLLPEGKKIGGAPANFVYHVSQFGLPGCVVSAVGEDKLGSEILEILEASGIVHNIDKVAFPTGTVEIEIDRAGIPKYDIKEDVAWDNIPFTAELEEIAKDTKAVCFGSLAQRSDVSRATICRFLDAIPAENDALIVFDINLRQRFYSKEIIRESMDRCNILKINDEELEIVSRMFDMDSMKAEDVCRRLMVDFNLRIIILTCGVNGSYVFTREGVSFLPTPEVEVADTVGAGDSFTAAFISGLLKGKSVAEAHKRAVETSAFVCSQSGAMPVLPDYLLK